MLCRFVHRRLPNALLPFGTCAYVRMTTTTRLRWDKTKAQQHDSKTLEHPNQFDFYQDYRINSSLFPTFPSFSVFFCFLFFFFVVFLFHFYYIIILMWSVVFRHCTQPKRECRCTSQLKRFSCEIKSVYKKKKKQNILPHWHWYIDE